MELERTWLKEREEAEERQQRHHILQMNRAAESERLRDRLKIAEIDAQRSLSTPGASTPRLLMDSESSDVPD